MQILIVILLIVVPPLMAWAGRRWLLVRVGWDVLAYAAGIAAGAITGNAVYRIKVEHRVFTTMIHGIFDDPLFLASSAYLGLYAFCRMAARLISRRRQRD